MAQNVILKVDGLYTFDNNLSSVPEGALLKADNIIIDKKNIAESRRGFKLYGDSLSGSVDNRTKQLLVYKERVLRHYSDIIDFDNGSGTFQSFSGSYTEVDPGLRIKSREANGNLYFTTDEGIKKISATSASQFSASSGYIVDAGGPKALEASAIVNYSLPGFLSPESKTSYRIVWGYNDANNNLVLGTPSPRAIVSNTSTVSSGTVDVTFSIPSGVVENIHFYQLYRTAVAIKTLGLTLDDVDPGDEHFLIYEGKPTNAEMLAKNVTFNDITPEDFRSGGTLLYTNPISGEGISQANEPPPLAKDLSFFKGSMFFSNTRTRHKLQLNLLSLLDFENNSIITSISVANPTVITTSAIHALETGDVVYIHDSDSTPLVDGSYTITKLSPTTFSIPVNVTVAGTVGVASQTPQILISDGISSNVYSFRGVTEITEVTCVASAAMPLTPNFGYTLINSHSDLRRYAFWFDTTALSNGVAPSGNADLIGKILIKVATPPLFTDAQVAAAFTSELNNISASDFTATSLGAVVTISHNYNGPVTDASNGIYSPTFTYNILTNGVGEDSGNKTFILSNLTSVSQQVDQSARSIVSIVNKQIGEIVNSYYISDANDVPGQILFEKINLADNKFYIASLTSRINLKFNSNLPSAFRISSISTGSNTPTITTELDHTLTTGDKVIISDTTSFPSIIGEYTITVTGLNTFTITTPSIIITSSPGGYTFEPNVISDNEVKPNRLYWSKYQQPDAVPTVNYVDVGPKDQPILRIIALRENLFIMKTDAIYRLSGENTNNFVVSLFDSSTVLKGPDSAVALNNQIYMYSDQGIATISDTGVGIISRPIENLLLKISSALYPNFSTATFALAYETERCYLVFTVTETDDEVATQCFRFNTFTRSWVRWPISKTCGIVGPGDKIYLGADDTNYIERERKDFLRSDYADRDFQVTIGENDVFVNEKVIELSSVSNIDAGDVIIQTQYLTISSYNKLLKKLDIDNELDDVDYYSALLAMPGDNMALKLTALKNKLNIDDSSVITISIANTDISTATDEISYIAHGFSNGQAVQFSTAGTLPLGITANTIYYVRDALANTFKLTTTISGAAFNFITDGSGTHTISSAYTFSGVNIFTSLQSEFNNMVLMLNASPNVFYTNYSGSTGTNIQEALITSVVKSQNQIVLNYVPALIVGPCTIYKGISTEIEWVPQHMGDPSTYKHLREGTALFDVAAFSGATLSYKSDLSQNFESITFNGQGTGVWGLFEWGNSTWGGDGNKAPFRTLIPRDKQRCRYISCKYKHINAREIYMLYGISLTGEFSISSRAYK